VIFKNILRDVRKFFTRELNERLHFKRKQRLHGAAFYKDCVCQLLELKLTAAETGALGVSLEALYSLLGSMVYPKKMATDRSPLAIRNCARVHRTLY